MCHKDEIIYLFKSDLGDYFYSYKEEFKNKIISDIVNILKLRVDPYIVIKPEKLYSQLHKNDKMREGLFILLETSKKEKEKGKDGFKVTFQKGSVVKLGEGYD